MLEIQPRRVGLRQGIVGTYPNRDVVLKFNGCYHGTVDDVFVDLVNGQPQQRDSLLGQVHNLLDTTVVVEFNDLPALQAALVDNDRNNKEEVRQVVFITDGSIGNEDQLFAAIHDGLGRSRLFTVGIGSAPNAYFMTRAARQGRGVFCCPDPSTRDEDRHDRPDPVRPRIPAGGQGTA